jgi:hypothetical protein
MHGRLEKAEKSLADSVRIGYNCTQQPLENLIA